VLGCGAWSCEEQLPGLVDYEAVPHVVGHDAHLARFERQGLRLIAEVKDNLDRARQAHQYLIAAWVHLPVAVFVHADDAEEAPIEIVFSERLPEVGRGGVKSFGHAPGCQMQKRLLGIQGRVLSHGGGPLRDARSANECGATGPDVWRGWHEHAAQ